MQQLLFSPSHAVPALPISRVLLAAILLLPALLPAPASAHFTLYHNIEINLNEPRTLQLMVLIHDPDITEDLTDASFIAQTFGFDPTLEFEARLEEDAEDIPEDCHLVTLEARNPGGELEVTLSPEAQKRLLLVVSRPKTFPETRDVGPGQTYILDLGDKPPMPFVHYLVYLFVMAGVLAGTVYLLRRRSFASLPR